MVDPDEGWYNAVLSKSPEAYNEAEVKSFEDKMNGLVDSCLMLHANSIHIQGRP